VRDEKFIETHPWEIHGVGWRTVLKTYLKEMEYEDVE